MKANPYRLIALGLLAGALSAQTTSPATAPAAPAKDEVIVLSPFVVSGVAGGRYQASEATSGSRVRVSLFESSQSVSVVTRELIDDIGAGRVLDAAKYVSGVYESTIPNAQDRTTIRGFQNDGATVDGFSYFSFANLDPVIIDRIEVVKGPNAIIAPQGLPGGIVNNVSKKPLFSNQGSVSAQVGLYSANRVEIDVNRVLTPGKLAVRVVGATQAADDYGDGNFHGGTTVMPMFTYRFTPGTQLTVQAQLYNWSGLNFLGVPISLYATSTSEARLLDGLPRDFVPMNRNITRHQSAQHYRVLFTTSFSDNLSMRVAANWIDSNGRSAQLNTGAATVQVTTTDPATGLRVWDGTTRNDSPVFSQGGALNTQTRTYVDFQNDFVYEVDHGGWKSSTVVGYALNFAGTYNETNQNFTVASSPVSYTTGYVKPTGYTLTNVTGINTRHFRNQQYYLFQSFTLLDERLILSGSYSYNKYYSGNNDQFRTLRAAHTPAAGLPAAGLVYKLNKSLALYGSFSEQATAINPSVTATNFFTKQTSQQHEFGARIQAMDNRLYATLAYFDIKQNNFSVPNPLNSAVPVPSPALPPIFSDRLAHGVEAEINFALSKNFSLVGNAAVIKNRDANGVPFRGTAEKSGAIWAGYTFDKGGPLGGVTLGLGADYLAKRAGDIASGVTSASTPAGIIRVQPSFWLPARTLVNASLTYRANDRWKAQLNLDNLFNEEYLQSSINRVFVWPGQPFNARLNVTYSF